LRRVVLGQAEVNELDIVDIILALEHEVLRLDVSEELRQGNYLCDILLSWRYFNAENNCFIITADSGSVRNFL
jgi:hypothetical protein